MSCKETRLDVQIGAFPLGFKGNIQQMADKFAELLIVTFPDDISTFKSGNSEPPTNQGPWFNTSVEPAEWYVWSDVQGKYIALGLDASRIGYQISTTEPDETKFRIWLEVDTNNELQNIYTHNGTSWVSKLVNEDRLNQKTPKGIISMWSGTTGTIPSRYRLCAPPHAGTTVNGVVVPDLSDKFIVGSGATYAIGNSGGSVSGTTTFDLDGETDGHALIVDEIPSHDHGPPEEATTVTGGYSINVSGGQGAGDEGGFAYYQRTGNTGGGQEHTHSVTGSFDVSTASLLPPYYALGFIIFVDEEL